MFTPKVLNQTFYTPCGVNNASRLANADVNALLVSQSHLRDKRTGNWASGGEFLKVSFKSRHGCLPLTMRRVGSNWTGTAAGCGNLTTGLPTVGSPSANGPNIPNLIASFGTIDDLREANKIAYAKGWEMTRPGAPEASLAQFLVELRDFPLVPGSQLGRKFLKRVSPRQRKKHQSSFFRYWISGPVEQIPWKIQMQMGAFKALGSEYLNHVFGWVPFVQDLQKLYVLSQTVDNRIRQIQRDNSRGIRRRATVRNDYETSSSTQSTSTGAFYGAIYAPPNWGSFGKSTWTTTTKIQRRLWFSARYRYYIPDVASGDWIPRAKLALAGGVPSPSLLWELTPWSWLVDWFGNVGTVLSNFSENAVENLTADYSFLMINIKATTTSTSAGGWTGFSTPPGPISSDVPTVTHSLSSVYESEVKARVLGSPYGLGIEWNDLSSRQLGVLAALGITKSSF